MTDVKICGVRRAEDAELAVRLGARYVGLNFSSKSPRRVSLAAAREIAAATGSLGMRVGVFVDEGYGEIAAAAEAGGIDLVQIHRPLRREDFDAIALPIIAVARVCADGLALPRQEDLGRCRALLYDTLDPLRAGGSGVAFDWRLAAGESVSVPIFLAGGLTPENVGGAIRQARPAAVDVASGVESAPGVKDPEKMRRFIEAVDRADAEGRPRGGRP
jgi:phosphoribosylanthranilate isomerase